MKVKMIKSEKGAEDGIHVKTFESGVIYDIVEKLAKIFVNTLGVAVFVQDEPAVKSMSAAPENKAVFVDDVKDKKRK